MRNSIRGKLLLLGACWMAGVAAWGQEATLAKPNAFSLDVAFTYNAMLGNVTTGADFWMQGGSAQVHGRVWRGLGLVADVAGLHTGNMNNSGVGLDLVTATFGPRYAWSRARSRCSFFGEALGGESFGRNSTFPVTSSTVNKANSLAMQLGGGVDFSLSRWLAVRAIEADWLRSQVPNATTGAQNNLRIGAGIVLRLR
jgi:hypothetical protein